MMSVFAGPAEEKKKSLFSFEANKDNKDANSQSSFCSNFELSSIFKAPSIFISFWLYLASILFHRLPPRHEYALNG